MEPGLVTVTLKVQNKETRATTPLTINLELRFRENGKWGTPVSVIHPAAFVLNRKEQQILRGTVKRSGDAVRADLTIREQETGELVKRERVEKDLAPGK